MKTTGTIATTGLALLSLIAAPASLFAAEQTALTARVTPGQQVAFDVYLPIQHRAELERDLENIHNPNHASFHKWLTPAEFNARYGASATQITAIKQQLAGYGLDASVVSASRLHVKGNAGNIEQALGTVLKSGVRADGKGIVAAAEPLLPLSSFSATGAVVLGLNATVHMRTHSLHSARTLPAPTPANRYTAFGGYWFDDLKQAYQFPSYLSLTGKGITIATLVDGAYSPADMTKYFGFEGLAVPNFSEVNVDGGAPFSSGSFETDLDFEQAGGMAPGAKLIHYNIPDLSDQSIVDGLATIIADNKADIVSMSFGGPEIYYTAGDNAGVDYTYVLKLEDDLFAQGNMQGITFVASSGDEGAYTAPTVPCLINPALPHCGPVRLSAEFPASSPHVTGVGGTNLVTSRDGSINSTYAGEEAYADPLSQDIFYHTATTGMSWGSGGGISMVFPRPSYQILATTGSTKYRTVPDVSGHMGGCPGGVAGACNPADSFVYEVFNGNYYGAIGTSASAPDFAGLTALAEQSFGGRLGNLNQFIYSLALAQAMGSTSPAFHQGIPGFNGKYFTSATGYNKVLGNGTVIGTNFVLAPGGPTAGTPRTPSNP